MSAAESATRELLREQLDYYRERASEYDQWWLRQGRYDRGTSLNAQWFADATEVSSHSGHSGPLAAFGIWSEQLLPFASQFTALDGSGEMLAINAARLRAPLGSLRES